MAWAQDGRQLVLVAAGDVVLCGADGSVTGRWGLGASGPGRLRSALDAGERLVAVASGPTVELWSFDGALLARSSVGADVESLGFSGTGDVYVVTGPPDRAIAIYSVAAA